MLFDSDTTFLNLIRDLQLAESSRLQEHVTAAQANKDDIRALAEDLVEKGTITAYQAEELIEGRGEQLVCDQYCLLEPLGEGGMGRVFKARHRLMGRIVALKVIRQELLEKPEAVARFRREIQMVSQLSHPNIVTAHDAELVSGQHFLVMEYCEGQTLSQIVQAKGPLSFQQARNYIHQAAEGLQHAFERDVIHRDVKPQNLLVTTDNVVKILDMGLARLGASSKPGGVTDLTQDHTLMGTPDYVAPEQAKDPRKADIRSDLYSLGCTFYYLLAGRVPFPGGTTIEKVLRHELEEPETLAKLCPKAPIRLVHIVRRLMAKDPRDRYQTPQALLADLDTMARSADEEGNATETTHVKKTQAATNVQIAAESTMVSADEDQVRSTGSKRRVLWIAVIGVALVLAVIAAVFIWPLLQPSPPFSEKDRLQGKWNLVSAEFKGKPLPVAKLKDVEWTKFSGDRQTTRYKGKTWSGRYALDTSSMPKGLEFISEQYEKVMCIYQLSGDNLIIAQGSPGDPRPKSFATTAETTFAVYRYYRASAQPPPPVAPNTSTKHSPPAVDWTWVVEHHESINCVAFSPTSNLLAFAAGNDSNPETGGVVKLLDVEARKTLATLTAHSGEVRQVAFSPDGKTLVSAGGDINRPIRSVPGKIILWDVHTKKKKGILEGHKGGVHAVTFASGGKLLISAGADKAVRIWDAVNSNPLGVLPGGKEEVYALAVSPVDDNVLATGSEGGLVRLWNIDKRTGRMQLPGRNNALVWSLAFSHDGAKLVVADHIQRDGATEPTQISFWDLAKRKLLHHTIFEQLNLRITDVAFSPDGKTVVAACSDGIGRLWDAAQWKPLPEIRLRPEWRVWSLAFSFDGKYVAAGSNDGYVIVWPWTGTGIRASSNWKGGKKGSGMPVPIFRPN